MGKSSPDQTPLPSQTDVLSASDESFSVAEEGRPIPYFRGQRKIAVRFVIGPFYGQHEWEEKPSGGGKGGGGKKGGSSGTKHVSGTVAGVIGLGPLDAIDGITLNAETVWSGPLLRSASTNPVNLSTKYGTVRLYWGTENQTADATLNQYEEHPPYRGVAYLVFVDFDHGQSTTAYNTEVICRAGSQQTLITGSTAAETLDGAMTVNPIVHGVELLTSPAWLGLPNSKIVAASAQALADAIQGEAPTGSAPDRSASAVSPLYADATDTRSAFAAVLGMADAWSRITPGGQIELGRWLRGATPASVTTLTHDDFSEQPSLDPSDDDEAANSYAVEFTDSAALHKEAKLTVDDQAGIVNAQRLIRKTLKADWLITADQAERAGQEALRRSSARGTWSGAVRWGKALTPTGLRLQPGDYLRIPLSQPEEEAQEYQLIRITKVVRPKDATSRVEIEGQIEPPEAAKLGTVVSAASTDQPGLVVPPIVCARVLALPPPADGAQPPAHVLGARPIGLASSIGVYYDDSAAGDFPYLGRQSSFALPVTLVASVTAAATTVRIALRPKVADVDLQRDSGYLRNWIGGITEGRNDELLLVLLRKEDSGAISGTAGAQEVEVLSISGAPTLVSADTFDVAVLRGRRGTTARAFSTGSFPDAWAYYEGWVIPRYSLVAFAHSDFAGLRTSGGTGYLRLGAVSAGGRQYAPADAWAERERRTAAAEDLAEFGFQPDAITWVPALTARIPTSYAPVVGAATGVTVNNATNGLTATNTQGAIDELAARPQQPVGGTVGQPLVRTADGSMWSDLALAKVTGLAAVLTGLENNKQAKLINAAALAYITEATDGTMLWKGAPVGAAAVVLLLGVSAMFSTIGGGVPVGDVATFDTGWGWYDDGYAVPIPYTASYDDFAGITDGPISSWSTGTGWSGSGYAVT